MTTRSLVDPELLDTLDAIPKFNLSDENLHQLRDPNRKRPTSSAQGEALMTQVRKSMHRLESVDGAVVDLFIYAPTHEARSARPCVLHMHGGGFVGGDAALLEPGHRAIVHALDCVLVSVNYRLAPETPYPGALQDCAAALRWIHANADALGIDKSKVGVMGESAGGGLAAALTLYMRDHGDCTIAFQHLIYPMLDDRTCVRAPPHPITGEFVWTPASNLYCWTALLGRAPGGRDVSPYAAPARAENLEGLPPTYIATGALDLFLDEDVDYATRLMRAGVTTELRVYAGAFHGFDLCPTSRVAATARADSFNALRRALYG